MIWYDVMWYDMMWYAMNWCDMIWYVLFWICLVATCSEVLPWKFWEQISRRPAIFHAACVQQHGQEAARSVSVHAIFCILLREYTTLDAPVLSTQHLSKNCSISFALGMQQVSTQQTHRQLHLQCCQSWLGALTRKKVRRVFGRVERQTRGFNLWRCRIVHVQIGLNLISEYVY